MNEQRQPHHNEEPTLPDSPRKQFDLVCLGELLMDFLSVGGSTYKANAGGAPANVVCAAQTFGLASSFIGAVGEDFFGQQLIRTLEDHHVNTEGIEELATAFTTMAFVNIDEEANRSFSFARKPGADTRLRINNTHLGNIEQSLVLHFGSLSLTDEPARSSTYRGVEHARKKGTLVSFDPNLRLSLWESKEALIEQVNWGIRNCDLLKLSEEDLMELDPRAPEEVIQDILHSTHVQLVLLTTGRSGSHAYWPDPHDGLQKITMASDDSIVPVDTTGAGDIYMGAFLSRFIPLIKERAMNGRSKKAAFLRVLEDHALIRESIAFANQVAGLSTEKEGGIPSIPTVSEWESRYC